MKNIIYVLCISANLFAQFQPQTTEELQTAVNQYQLDCTSDSYGDINAWDVSLITDMSSLFYDFTNFNCDISSWDVSNVTNMSYMLGKTYSFNQNISSWDVSTTINMEGMFNDSYYFDQDISSWDVSNVTNMTGMFYNASSFNQDISSWNVVNVTSMFVMLDGTALSENNQCSIHTAFSSNESWPYDWSEYCENFDNIFVPNDFLTINEAMNVVEENDTIFVTEGVYAESISINHSMSLIGYPGVVIDGSGYNAVINIEADSVLVQGFEIIGDTLTVGGIIVLPGSEHITLRDNVIHGMQLPNESSALLASYGILSYGDGSGPPNPPRNLIIENNEIYDINAFGISLGSFSDSVFIKNNYIHDIDRIDLSPYGYDEDLSVGVIAQFGGWIQIEDNDFSNVLLGSNLYFSYGEVSNNTYDDSTKIYLAYNDTNPINIPDSSSFPQNASATRFGEFGGISGTVIAHLKNIQDAIDYADNMTEIYVTSGVFFENINISGKDISLIGENPINTFISSNDWDYIFDLDSSNVLIKDFSIINDSYGINAHNNTNLILENSLINATTSSLNIQNSNSTLDNVTIIDNISGLNLTNSTVSISNSIINGNISIMDSSILEITYSNVFGGFEGEGNINEDPLFCDPENNDFSLASNSPCLGSGFEGDNMGVFDIGCESIVPEITEFLVYYNFNEDIAGFQFDLDGANILGAYGGVADSNGFMISTSETTVLGISLAGEVISVGSGILCVLEIEGNIDNVCLNNLLLAGSGGVSIDGNIENCNTIVVDTEQSIEQNILLEEYKISNVYPNPFNPIATISYIIPKPSNLIISIYDIGGNSLEILRDEYTYPGEYSVQWNGEKFPSGIYFVNFKTKNFNRTKKLMLIK